ncbi:MAG TPA: hypothetical protein DIT49_00685 [Clostridiales bacterium]|nr:hypothetical protein [Clostridiales bacterium]
MSRQLYDALAAKARAMYGKHTHREDLERIARMEKIGLVLDQLRQMPAWAESAALLEEETLLTRGRLEQALRAQVRREGLRLLSFVPQQDREVMEFPVLRMELERILAALRRLHASMFKEVDPLPREYITHSKVDFEGLRQCRDFDGLADAAAGSIYGPALHRLRGSLPDYGTTEVLLWSVYYRHLLNLVRRRYAGDTKRVLEQTIGAQADMLNIMHILRMKRFFPEVDNYLPVLLPYHYKVGPEQVHAMCQAKSVDGVLELIDQTPYAATFRDVKAEDWNNRYAAMLYRFSRRQLRMGPPSIYSAVAYMNLRELELKAVVSAVESAKYRRPLDASLCEILDP